MRIVAACLVLVACGSSRSLPRVAVIAESGDAPEPRASVVSHTADGTVIDRETPDATGVARVEIEPGALITVVFPSTPQQIVTTLAPAAGAEIVVHGPAPVIPQTGVGALGIMPAMPLDAAGGFDIALGCVTIHVATLPTTVDVNGACLGSDLYLDVLIRGYDANQQLVGYAAGHVMIEGDVAEFDPPMWATTGTSVPIALTGVAPALAWTLSRRRPAVRSAADHEPGAAVDRPRGRLGAGRRDDRRPGHDARDRRPADRDRIRPDRLPAGGHAGPRAQRQDVHVDRGRRRRRPRQSARHVDRHRVGRRAAARRRVRDVPRARPRAAGHRDVVAHHVDSSDLPDFATLDEIFAEQTATAGAIVALPGQWRGAHELCRRELQLTRRRVA